MTVPRRRAPWPAFAAALALAPAVLRTQAAGPAAPGGELQERVRLALDKARPRLLSDLEQAVEQNRRTGEIGLLALAALHDGVDPASKPLANAIEAVAKARLEETYDLALRLFVLEAHQGFPERESLAKDDARALLRNRDGGAFGYSPESMDWDLSNTQYAALGLRSATACGAEVARSVWNMLAATVLRAQHDDGGFAYVGGERKGAATPSMTVAGIAVLEICVQMLAKDGSPAKAEKLERAIAKGWKWMGDRSAEIGELEGPWCHYFHYGLLRAAVLGDVERVGGVDWYRAGAGMLCDSQTRNGAFPPPGAGGRGLLGGAHGGDPVSTAFGVLFLRRKFAKVVAPVATPRLVLLGALTPQSGDDDVAACVATVCKRGKGAVPDLLAALRSDVVPRRRAAVRALAEIAGTDFGIDPARDAEANRAALTKAELWHLKNK